MSTRAFSSSSSSSESDDEPRLQPKQTVASVVNEASDSSDEDDWSNDMNRSNMNQTDLKSTSVAKVPHNKNSDSHDKIENIDYRATNGEHIDSESGDDDSSIQGNQEAELTRGTHISRSKERRKTRQHSISSSDGSTSGSSAPSSPARSSSYDSSTSSTGSSSRGSSKGSSSRHSSTGSSSRHSSTGSSSRHSSTGSSSRHSSTGSSRHSSTGSSRSSSAHSPRDRTLNNSSNLCTRPENLTTDDKLSDSSVNEYMEEGVPPVTHEKPPFSENFDAQRHELWLLCIPDKIDVEKLLDGKQVQMSENGDAKVVNDGDNSSLVLKRTQDQRFLDRSVSVVLPNENSTKMVSIGSPAQYLSITRQVHVPQLNAPTSTKKGRLIPQGLKHRNVPLGATGISVQPTKHGSSSVPEVKKKKSPGSKKAGEQKVKVNKKRKLSESPKKERKKQKRARTDDSSVRPPVLDFDVDKSSVSLEQTHTTSALKLETGNLSTSAVNHSLDTSGDISITKQKKSKHKTKKKKSKDVDVTDSRKKRKQSIDKTVDKPHKKHKPKGGKKELGHDSTINSNNSLIVSGGNDSLLRNNGASGTDSVLLKTSRSSPKKHKKSKKHKKEK